MSSSRVTTIDLVQPAQRLGRQIAAVASLGGRRPVGRDQLHRLHVDDRPASRIASAIPPPLVTDGMFRRQSAEVLSAEAVRANPW